MSLVSEKVIEEINPKPKLSRRKVALQSVGGEALVVKGSTDLEFRESEAEIVSGLFAHMTTPHPNTNLSLCR